MEKIVAAEIEKKFPGTGRAMGAKLAELVKPGDIIDFKDFITITNSFADEFVKIFLHKYGHKEFHTLRFENANSFLLFLLKKAFERRKCGVPRQAKIEIKWESVAELPF